MPIKEQGYILVDNRVSGMGMQEASTYTCTHCHAVVVMNVLRTRERGYCRKCSAHICDACAATMARTLECRPLEQLIDEVLNQAAKTA